MFGFLIPRINYFMPVRSKTFIACDNKEKWWVAMHGVFALS